MTRRSRAVAIGVVGLYAGPILVDLLAHGPSRVFRYFASDGYLFFAVARNAARTGIFTTDGVHASNGFHPLWQAVLTGIYRLTETIGAAGTAVLLTVFLLQIALVALGLVLVCGAYARARGRLPLLFLVLPLGVFGLVGDLFPTNFGSRGSLWGFTNGMESPLVLLGFGMLMAWLVRRDPVADSRAALGTGLLLGLLILARLDVVFLGLALCAVVGVHSLRLGDGRRSARVLLVALPVVLSLSAYLLWSLGTVGVAFPVSGTVKTVAPNLDNLAAVPDVVMDPWSRWETWRLAQILLPFLVALWALVRERRFWGRRRPDGLQLAWVATAVFVVLLGLHNLFRVPLIQQGHWYFPISTLFVTLYLLDAVTTPGAREVGLPAAAALAVLLAASVLVFFARMQGGPDPLGPRVLRDFVEVQAPTARRHYGDDAPEVLSFDDGVVAYATEWPVMTGRGFMLDLEAVARFLDPDRSLLELAVARGFDRLTAAYYFDWTLIRPESSSASIRRLVSRRWRLGGIGGLPSAWGIQPWEWEQFDYEVDYLSPDGRFGVIQVVPRRDGPSVDRQDPVLSPTR